MSAAAARRRKQKLQKQKEKELQQESTDPITLQLNNLLNDSNAGEAGAYEALQLAQSQVRRAVKEGRFSDAPMVAYDTAMVILEKHGRVSVASQLLGELIKVLNEVHEGCTDEWVERLKKMDVSYRKALDGDGEMDKNERERLQRLHLKFLRGLVRWSESLGTVRYGHLGLHDLLASQCWRMAAGVEAVDDGYTDDEDEESMTPMALRCEAVTHLALAEKPSEIIAYLKALPPPTAQELELGHTCPPSERDSLLTRSILAFVAVENLRDANTLLRAYMSEVETRDIADLRKSYMNKSDGIAPSHVIFNCSLLRMCEKEEGKTSPLFSWLLRNFSSELTKMYDMGRVKAYTTKIGRVYFGIQPPPNMMNTLENMMGMLGGGMGGGPPMGGGGAPGMPPGGINPAMMQAMMQSMQGGEM